MAVIYGSTNNNLWTFRLDVYNIPIPNTNNQYYDVNANTSLMRVDVWLGRSATASNSYIGGKWNGHISIDWQTPNQKTETISGTIPYPTTVNAGGWVYLATKDFTITHDNDGKKVQRVVAEVSSSEFTPSYCVADGNVTLVTIPRATKLPTIGSVEIERPLYIQLAPHITNATHSIKLWFGDLHQWVQEDGSLGSSERKLSGNNITIQVPKEYYTQFSGQNGTGSIYLYTYNGNNKVGEDGSSFKVICNSSLCTPIIDATAIDINELSLGLTGDENSIIANVSKVLITPEIQVSDTDDTTAFITSKTIDSTVFTTDTATIFGPTKKDFLLSVTNSRGFTGKKTISASGNFIPYTLLTFSIDALYRPEATGSEIILKYSGRFFTGNFAEDVPNELTLWWKYKTGNNEYVDGGTLTPTIDVEKNTYSGEVVLGDMFDYRNQYNFQFFYKDKIVGIDDDTFVPGTVTRGIPVFWWTKDSFHIEGDLHVEGQINPS